MFGMWRKNRSMPAVKVKLGLEAMEDRLTPAHLNPGVG
jgi:hypothetical protein